jgi:hypothetical protein
MNKNQKGFGILELCIILVVVGIIGVVVWRFISSQEDNKKTPVNSSSQEATASSQPDRPIWQQTAEGWQSTEKAPNCPTQPMLKAPADLSKVTSVLYPGQTRGQYKPHGGLRFDNITDNKVTVNAPIDGYIVKATRNFAQGTTEIQYGFDIMNNCGIMTRFGHLREIPAKLQTIVDKLPEASADSRIENVNPPVYIKKGEVLATMVGTTFDKNTFFDWGVYDYRHTNEASKSATYQAAHPQKEHAWYAVCWLKDWLPASDVATLGKLPAGGGENGTASDYCK